ncbi:hypothetical protein FE257_000598 [Aspergillus nanangensis]|uniref:Serine hydrolase domain-containing protein n=1 Tax=Aspergillus nanangensis TaxID=2582783 RepID=A0AAD4GRB0_ASPNN|nr:hypothetical protein FE257_000598 [Aspergillus nanangensis]
MHFLCLHGKDMNSKVAFFFFPWLRIPRLPAAIRYELGGDHTYDFVEGSVPCGQNISGDEVFAYCDVHQLQSTLQAVCDLEQYIQAYGPYDAVFGFSLGAAIALACLIYHYETKDENTRPPVKLAVFFSTPVMVYDYKAFHQGRIRRLEVDDIGRVVDIPTAHIWSSGEDSVIEKYGPFEYGELATQVCKPDRLSVYIHDQGHIIPNSTEDVVGIGKVINRAIVLAGGL